MQRQLVKSGEDTLLGTGQVNDCQFSDLSERQANILREEGDELEFKVVLQIFHNGRLSGVSIDSFTHNVQQKSAKVTIPRDTFRRMGFEFKTGDQNVHQGDTKFQRGTGSRIMGTLYVVG